MKISWRIWLLIAVLILSIIAIAPSFQKGAIIKSVEKNSTAYEQGLRTNMIITAINGETVNNFQDYTKIISLIFPNSTNINKSTSSVITPVNSSKTTFSQNISSLNNSNITDINETLQNNSSLEPSNKNKIKLTITTENSEFILFADEPLL